MATKKAVSKKKKASAKKAPAKKAPAKSKSVTSPASTKPSRSALSAFASGKATLGGHGVPGCEIVETDGSARFSLHGNEYATLDIQGDGVVVSFRPAPTDVDAVRTSGHFANAGSGWYRIELTRNPRTWLAADVGTLVGRAIYALRTDK